MHKPSSSSAGSDRVRIVGAKRSADMRSVGLAHRKPPLTETEFHAQTANQRLAGWRTCGRSQVRRVLRHSWVLACCCAVAECQGATGSQPATGALSPATAASGPSRLDRWDQLMGKGRSLLAFSSRARANTLPTPFQHPGMDRCFSGLKQFLVEVFGHKNPVKENDSTPMAARVLSPRCWLRSGVQRSAGCES